jgi:hypothetical protein
MLIRIFLIRENLRRSLETRNLIRTDGDNDNASTCGHSAFPGILGMLPSERPGAIR